MNFQLKTNIKFGAGEFQNLSSYIEDLEYKKIGVIVDSKVYEDSYVSKVLNDIECKIFSYELGEPTYTHLDYWRQHFESFDCIVGIGGGSVIDLSKGLAFLVNNKKPAIEYRGFPLFCKPSLPIIAIPTTAGTGSEVTYNAVFIEEKEKKKLGINTTLNFPTLAILDPRLIQTCPYNVMVSSGMDALTHAVESYGATKSNDITRMFSTKALELLMSNLSTISLNQNINVCSNLQEAAYLAGIALMNSGSGPAGALSYILGPKFNVPHGLAGAVFLPHIIEHNESKGFEYTIKNLAQKIYNLCDILEVPYNSLANFKIESDKDIKVLFDGIEILQLAFDQNPVPFTIEDAKEIIRRMI